MSYGEITFKKKKPKFNIGEEVYFVDIFTDYMKYILRKGKIVYAGDKQTVTSTIYGIDLIRENRYKIESDGKVYSVEQSFISKNLKKIMKEFNFAKIEV